MSQTPNPKSQEQILGEMLSDWLSRTGVDDLNVGSLSTQLFEVVSLMVARTSGDAFQILRDLSVDRAEGESLRRISRDEGLRDLPARVATGSITVTDTSFEKISTKIYTGARAPNIGSTSILVSDASEFPATGSLYLGRQTPNVEGPLAYTSRVQVGSFWEITLAVPTTKFHNTNETVILAQGGTRNIASGTVVRAPATGANPDINFTVTQSAIILDGETTISGVQVSAQEPGAVGNIPIGAIKEFGAQPFPGAAVTNTSPFRTGRDVETDEQLRIRIKRARLSRGLGTALAVKNSVVGATPSDENASVESSEIVTSAGQTTLFIDDNSGYEQKTRGVGIEFLVDSALGGETDFQLETGGRQTSVAKAFIVSNLSAPFDVRGTDRLAIAVGGVTTEHTFQDSDFISPGGATAFEIVASINANSALNFEAATAENGTKVSIQARAEQNEQVQAVDVTLGRNAAEFMGLPFNEVQTLRLFKNKKPLSKDGNTATIKTERQANWSNTIVSGDTLVVSVDGTANITYTFLDADFIADGSHPNVSSTNSLESWVRIINQKVTGLTASIVGEQIFLTSNLGASNRASISIDSSSTLVSKNMFSTNQGLVSLGKSSDFIFSRNTAQIKLRDPLLPNDELTAGSRETEARVQSARILGGSIFLSNDAYIWLLADDKDAQIVNTGVVASTLIAVSKPVSNTIRFTSSVPTAFSAVQEGDYVIVWSQELSAANRIEGRVASSSPSTLDIRVTTSEFVTAVVESGILFQEGFSVVRTSKVPQKFKISSGTKQLSQIADELNLQSKSIHFSTIDDEILIASTKTRNLDGSIFVVTFDGPSKPLGFVEGDTDDSKDSLVAYYESGYREGSFPVFAHSSFASGAFASPPDTFISSVSSALNPTTIGLDPDKIVGYLQPYGTVADALSTSETTELDNYSGATLTLNQDPLVKRLRTDDRYYFASSLDFGHEDEMVVILDGDAANKTFDIPFYRKAITNTSLAANPNTFNAYDLDAGPTASFTQFFDPSFSFDNFKVLMKAKVVVDEAANEDAILFRSVRWGRSGERVSVGYSYPTAPNSPILHTVSVGEDVDVKISLKSGAPVVTTIDGTTEWDVVVTPNVPVAGVDQVTYTWTGTGTPPGLGTLSGGEYVTISQGSELNRKNTGTYRVSTEIGFAPTASSFTVVRKNGEAVSELDRATLIANVFSFFQASPTTAAEIESYVAASTLADIVTAELVDDSGTSGAGVISRSTAEANNFVFDSYYLRDGVNWILASNISGSPQFTFKRPLSYVTDTGYAFNDGEELRIVPTSIEQAVRFSSVLAVSGFTTIGDISLTSREGRMELSTKILGQSGALQVIGGGANVASALVVSPSILIDNAYTLSTFNRSSLVGFHSDQIVKISASFKQAKETLFKNTASIKIDGDFPVFQKSRITLNGKTLTDRHFGKPRNHIRSQGRTFRVEKQGDLTCISWNGVGAQPFFSTQLNLNNTGSGTLNIERIVNTAEANIYILTGPTNFTQVSIGDSISISGMDNTENNGTFLVTGVSDNGKIIRILNQNAITEFSTATLNILDNSNIAGDEFIIGGNSLIAGVDFVVGATAADTAENLASAVSALPGVSATSVGSVVTVEALTPAANISVVYNDLGGGGGASVSDPFLVGRGYTITSFSCLSSVSEGDNVILSAPFNVLNRGKYRVIRRYENSIYIDNPISLNEDVFLPANAISTGVTGTTSLDVLSSDNKLTIIWDGTGTEPDFSVLRPGDELTLGTDFNIANQGTFTVLGAKEKLSEITRAKCVSANLITSGDYWEINAAADTTEYYVWYNVDGGGGDPLIPGKTAIPVAISSLDNAIQVANATAAAIDAVIDFDADASNDLVTISTVGAAETTDATEGNMDVNFDIEIVQNGRRTSLQALNPAAVAESGITVTGTFQAHRPQILFYEYDATVAGDKFAISSDFLSATNQNMWLVEDVIDENTIIVTGTMVDREFTSIAGFEEALFVEEEFPYIGYKKIRFIVSDPSSPQTGIAVFDTKEQFSKISTIGSVVMQTMNKLSFDTRLVRGLDSYRYHTGLIGEANRIVYGDPRDPITYPGVGAAGAEIFIREPLFKRVSVGIDVRIETGIPFAQITEQVRTNVAALIDGNPIGQAIAISDIVETVNTIPGVRAVAISSPLYNPSNDTISIAPSEKSRVIDPISDISVRQIGN